MGNLKILLYIGIVCCLTQERTARETGQFMGASMSFTLINGTNGLEIQLDVISGWVLGLGPCGINCSRESINSKTKNTKEEVLHRQGDNYFFGNWTVEYKMTQHQRGPTDPLEISDYVHDKMEERVIAMSENGGWEQDWMTLRYKVIPGSSYMDIHFDGSSWRNLSVQGPNGLWHLQVKFSSSIRSDTGKPNNSPQAFSKPIYRLLLGKDNYIRIATMDPEGDLVKCFMAEFVEAVFIAINPLRNVTVTPECVITVPSQRTLGYVNGSWGAIGITVRDYTRQDIMYGNYIANKMKTSFSAIGVQFLVQFLDSIKEPKFIYPTPEGNHRFNIYSGTTWKIDVYAEPISPALIKYFSCLGRQHEDVNISSVKDIHIPNHENVKMAMMMWTPLNTDVGEHILCVDVEDSVGMDSSDQRCYMLNVKPAINVYQSARVPNNKPYFINIPDKNVLWCDVNATCIFPMYARTPTAGAHITSIWLSTYYVDWAKNDTELINNGTGVAKIDISIRHLTGDSPTLCFYAQDSTGQISDETCINPRIIPPDPCSKAPCIRGSCKNPDDKSQFYCECPTDHYYGQFCEYEKSDCPPDRCLNGGTCRDNSGPSFTCNCTRGWTGRLCDSSSRSPSKDINDCKPGSCNNHGVCIDGVNSFSCDCFDRYQGDNCSVDRCNSSHNDKTCDEPGCHANSCTNNGVCTTGGKCHCSLGYEGSAICNMVKTFPPGQQARFVEPTFGDGSIITCYNAKPCHFVVFVAGGSNPEVGIQHVSDDLKTLIKVSTPVNVQYVPGLQNTLESVITIDAPPTGTFLGHQHVCLDVHESGAHEHGFSSRCFGILYIVDQSIVSSTQEFADKNKLIKFVDPTPKGQSQLTCKTNELCHLFVFTNKDSHSICHNVVSSSNVHVQPVKDRPSDCFTDISFTFPEKGPHTVCLNADETQGEKRCFTIIIILPSEDPCLSSPCKNSGKCLEKRNSTFECICGKEYTGLLCENGPCPATNWPCKHGYCEVNKGAQTCFCTLGYKGQNCTVVIPDEIRDPLNSGPIFTDTFIPKEVVCVNNKPCVIQFAISGNYPDPYRPTVGFGFVSPTIQKNDINTPRKANSTNATYTSEVSFTPKLPGNQKVCIQTLNKDRVNVEEICFDVDVKPDSSSFYGDKNKPHFIAPSITQNSTIVCTTGVTCHMMFMVSSGKSNENNCPTMNLTEGLDKDYHIFSYCEPCIDGTTAVGNCSMDLVFNPSSSYLGQSHRICLEAQLLWKKVTGEKLCFNMEVESGNVSLHGPCSNLHCKNGGFCDAGNANGEPICHCTNGYSGNTCGEDGSTSIANNTNRPSAGNFALPEEIICSYNESCSIPLQILGQPPNIPFVEPGHVPPTIDVEHLVVNSTKPTGTTFEGYLKIKPTGNGTQRVCIQSKDNRISSHVSEEICFNVQVTGESSKPPVDMLRPHYIDPTLPDGSTVVCKTESECHIVMFTSKKASNCPTVTEVSGYTCGLHIFPPASKLAYECVTDISYIPPKDMEGRQMKICLQASLPGLKGEVRCYNVTSRANANLITGLCINKKCENGGQCLSSPIEARCICRLGYSGVECADISETVAPPSYLPTSHGTGQPVFIDLAIPDTLICYENIECWLPVTVKGDVSHKPTVKFGHIDPTLSPGTSTLDDGSNNGVYSGNVPFTPSSLGLYRLCIQTADPISQVNVDEICCNVTVLSSSLQPSQAPFQKPTLNDNSTVKCQVNTACHILTYTDTEHGTCPDLTQAGLVDNIYFFPASIKDGKCVVDTTFTPSGNQTGSNRICMNTRNSDNTRCLNVQVEHTIKVSAPCKSKHCQNGGVCQAIDWINAECNCTEFFTGPQCESATCTDTEDTSAAERAREHVEAGRMSCFCNITTPGTNDTKWVQVIRPRHVATTAQMAKAGAVGAGAMVGVMAAVGVSILVVKKLKRKIGEKQKPLTSPKSKVGPTS